MYRAAGAAALRLAAGFAVALAALLATATAASEAPTSKGAATAQLHIRLHIPLPGDVSVARIVIRGRPGLGVPVRLSLRAVNADRLPPPIVAIGGVVSLHRRPLKFVTVITMVNTYQRGTPPPAGRFQRFLELDLLNARGAKPADAKHFYKAHVRVASNLLTRFGEVPPALRDLFQPVDADTATPLQVALHERGLDAIALAGLPRTSSVRDTNPDPHVVLEEVGDLAQAACDQDAEHTQKAEKKVEGDLATTLVQIKATPTAEKRCDLSTYSFKGLKLSFSAPGAGGAQAGYALSNIAGSVCGDPAKDTWNVTFTSTGERNRTAHPQFSKANPFTIATRRLTGGSLIAKLQYVVEAGPTMKVAGTPTGKVTKVVAQPPQVALTAKAVDKC